MTVADLIEKLKSLPQEVRVCTWEGDGSLPGWCSTAHDATLGYDDGEQVVVID